MFPLDSWQRQLSLANLGVLLASLMAGSTLCSCAVLGVLIVILGDVCIRFKGVVLFSALIIAFLCNLFCCISLLFITY